ncbi:MAG: ABC transporter substrate-binding protein [Candidatus Tectomicrobia bacterium]|nr:ABC transporter substrate-binding protein [Candidatus Tectomicrobia bacterium]
MAPSRHPYRTTLSIVALFLLVLIGLAARPAAAKLEGKEVKIGVINQVSGRFAAFGKDSEVGFKMAMERLEKMGGMGGLPVNFVFCDDASKSDEAIACVRKLANSDKVLAIIGPFLSASCKVAFPVAERLGIVAISHASAAPGLAAPYKFAFRAALTSDKLNAPTFALWAKKNPTVKTLVYLWDNSDVVYKGEHDGVFPDLFKKHGMQVLDDITFGPADIDFSAQVTRAKAKNPTGIIVTASYSQGANVVREIRRQGMTQPIYGGIGISSPEFIRQAGKSAEGVVNAQAFWPGNPDPKVKGFVDEYTKRHEGKPPPMYAAAAYDLMFMMKKVIEEGGVTNRPADLQADRDRIRAGFAKMKNYPSLAGNVSFNEDGDVVQEEPVPLVVKDGFWAKYE